MAFFQHHVRDIPEVAEVGPWRFPRPVCWLVDHLWGLGFLPSWASMGIPAAAIASGTLETQHVGQGMKQGYARSVSRMFSLGRGGSWGDQGCSSSGIPARVCVTDGRGPSPRDPHARSQNLREEERKSRALSTPDTRQGFLRGADPRNEVPGG